MSLTIRPLFTFRRPRGWTVLGALLVSLCGASAQAQRFDWDSLTQLAQTRATQPYRANSDKLPAELATITYDQLRDIRFKTDQSVWRAQNLPFEVQFFHLGLYQTEPVRIHELNADGTVNHLPYRSADFDQGKNTFDTSRWGDLGHAGFRLHYPLNGQTYKDELVVFQGASYFRALGAGQQYGLSARGLAIDTVGGTGEEFPRFSEFWLQRPAAGATEVTVLALLESPRATGAYRFVIRPGQQTTTTVNARVFLRAGAGPVNTLGMAPLHGRWFGAEDHGQPFATVVLSHAEWQRLLGGRVDHLSHALPARHLPGAINVQPRVLTHGRTPVSVRRHSGRCAGRHRPAPHCPAPGPGGSGTAPRPGCPSRGTWPAR